MPSAIGWKFTSKPERHRHHLCGREAGGGTRACTRTPPPEMRGRFPDEAPQASVIGSEPEREQDAEHLDPGVGAPGLRQYACWSASPSLLSIATGHALQT